MHIRDAVRRLVGLSLRRRDTGNEALYRSMVEQSGDVICHVADRAFTYVSPSASEVLGWNPAAMVGQDALGPIHELDRHIVENLISQLRVGQERLPPTQCRMIDGKGLPRWCETSASLAVDSMGGHHGVLVMRDISDRKLKEEELSALAMKDGLTGLANRRAFDEMLERTWRRTLQQGDEMTLVLLDIDHFKQFNDAYGHQAGDDCLRTVGAVLAKFARRANDLACRYGGEEFAVVMGSAGQPAGVQAAEEIRAAIESLGLQHATSSGFGHLTVSVGVATAVARVGGSIRMPESLVQAADHALYKAKAQGRNRVEQAVLIAPCAAR